MYSHLHITKQSAALRTNDIWGVDSFNAGENYSLTLN